jgi:demethylspheroidene O-methyltransferase
MAASQPLVAQQVVTAYPFARHRCLLDVGAGEGAFIAAVAAHAPQLRFLAFDLPAVAQRARVRLEGAGLGARAAVVGGDFLRDPLPAGADLITLVRVLHDHEDAAVAQLLARVRAALPAGGVVLVAEPLRGGAQARMADAYFGFYFLAMGRGRARSFGELAQLMEGAGFERVRHRRTDIPLQASVITAEARG